MQGIYLTVGTAVNISHLDERYATQCNVSKTCLLKVICLDTDEIVLWL